jgi:hypothetical protein
MQQNIMWFHWKDLYHTASVTEVQCEFEVKCECRIAPSRSSLNRLADKFEMNGTVVDNKEGVVIKRRCNTRKQCTCSTSIDAQSQNICRMSFSPAWLRRIINIEDCSKHVWNCFHIDTVLEQVNVFTYLECKLSYEEKNDIITKISEFIQILGIVNNVLK